jgi:hypothetical protein
MVGFVSDSWFVLALLLRRGDIGLGVDVSCGMLPVEHVEGCSFISRTNGYPRRWAMPFGLPISLLDCLGIAACDHWGTHDVGCESKHDTIGR